MVYLKHSLKPVLHVLIGLLIPSFLNIGLAQALSVELKGLASVNLATGTEIRIVWQDTNNSIARLVVGIDRKFSFDTPKDIQASLPAPLPLMNVLGLDDCSFTVTKSSTLADAKVVGADLVLYSQNQQPYALVELRGFEPKNRSFLRSVLVYAEEKTTLKGTGACPQQTFGQVTLDLSLKKGWSWIVYSTTQLPGATKDSLLVNTSVATDSKPAGEFELAPLRNR